MSGGWRAGRAVGLALFVIVGAKAAAAGAASAPGAAPSGIAMTVEVEHLVISPAPGQSRPAFDVLDVLRLAPGPWSAAGQALRIPLPAGYEGLRVIDGLVPASLQRQPDAVVGTIAKPGDGRQEGATVAIAYRIAGDALPHPWPVERPFTVGTLIVLLDPGLQASVVGASAAGTVDVEGRSYQAFVREQAAAADAPVLLVLGSAAGAGGGRPAGLAWNAAGALGLMGAGAALVLVLRRRRGRGAVAGSPERRRERSRSRVAEAIVALDAEYGAGYLEADRYERERARLLRELAGMDPATSRRPEGGDAAAPGSGVGP